MARDPQKRPEFTELIQRIERTRGDLGGHVTQLKHSLDLPSRMRNSVASNPLAWFGSSVGVGLIGSRIFRRKPKKHKKRGMTGLLFTAMVALLRPTLKGFLIAQLQRRLLSHTDRPNDGRETQLPLSKPQPRPSN